MRHFLAKFLSHLASLLILALALGFGFSQVAGSASSLESTLQPAYPAAAKALRDTVVSQASTSDVPPAVVQQLADEVITTNAVGDLLHPFWPQLYSWLEGTATLGSLNLDTTALKSQLINRLNQDLGPGAGFQFGPSIAGSIPDQLPMGETVTKSGASTQADWLQAAYQLNQRSLIWLAGAAILVLALLALIKPGHHRFWAVARPLITSGILLLALSLLAPLLIPKTSEQLGLALTFSLGAALARSEQTISYFLLAAGALALVLGFAAHHHHPDTQPSSQPHGRH